MRDETSSDAEKRRDIWSSLEFSSRLQAKGPDDGGMLTAGSSYNLIHW